MKLRISYSILPHTHPNIFFAEAYCPAPPPAPINAQIRRDLPEGEAIKRANKEISLQGVFLDLSLSPYLSLVPTFPRASHTVVIDAIPWQWTLTSSPYTASATDPARAIDAVVEEFPQLTFFTDEVHYPWMSIDIKVRNGTQGFSWNRTGVCTYISLSS